MRLIGSSGAEAGRPSLLPALFGVLLAIVFWMLADSAREDLKGVESQIATAQRTANRFSDSGQTSGLQASLEEARAQRTELTSRLNTTETAQMIRAKIVYDLRQKCAATGATGCSVRLADDTIAATRSGAGSNANSTGSTDQDKLKLIDLGIQKARAIVSGTFQNEEIVEFAKLLQEARDAAWRINGIVIRERIFEFDVERHIITAPVGGS